MKKREFIVQDLLSKIYQEEFKDGKLPNQRKLAEIYHVSRFTIQQAIKNLERNRYCPCRSRIRYLYP